MLKTRIIVLVAACLVLGPVYAAPLPQDAAEETAPPSPPASALARALAELEQDRMEAAAAILEEAVPAGDSDPRIPALLGAIYVELGRHAEALEVLSPLAENENADIAVLYNAGRAAAALEQYPKAERYLEASLAAFPESPAARELGFLNVRRGQFMAAYLYLKPWCRNHPLDTEAVRAAATCAVQLGRGAEAEQLLRALPTEEPEIKLLWANALLLKGDAWSALAVAKDLAQAPPEALEPQALTLLADVYLELEQPDLVVATLEGKTAKRPLLAVRLARALRQQGKVDEALTLLRPFSRGLIDDDPEVGQWLPGRGAAVALEYGRLLAAASRHPEAVSFLRASTELSSQDADAWRALAESLEKTGDMAQASDALARADRIERVSGREPSGVSGGWAGSGAGLDPAAADEATGSDPDPTLRQLRRGQALLELGAEEDGLRIARQEKTLVPEDPRPPLVEAQMLMRLGRRDEALGVMDAAVASFPANADTHYYRAVVQMALDRLQDSELSFDRALELAPSHTPALTDKAVLLVKLGRRDEARELLERVLVIAPGDRAAGDLLAKLGSS